MADKIFHHFGSFFALLPHNDPENETFEKIKKLLADIIILHMCTINDNHIMYGSWDMECHGQDFFFILDHFCPFTYPSNNPKINIFKKWKKVWIYHHNNNLLFFTWWQACNLSGLTSCLVKSTLQMLSLSSLPLIDAGTGFTSTDSHQWYRALLTAFLSSLITPTVICCSFLWLLSLRKELQISSKSNQLH